MFPHVVFVCMHANPSCVYRTVGVRISYANCSSWLTALCLLQGLFALRVILCLCLHVCSFAYLCAGFVFSVCGSDCILVNERGAGQDLSVLCKQNMYFPNSSTITYAEWLPPTSVRTLIFIHLLHHGLILLEWWVFEALGISAYLGCVLGCSTICWQGIIVASSQSL